MTNARGIDISAYQAKTPPLDGLSFLIARASIGTVKDYRYDQHIANARNAGLVVGAYHFAYTGNIPGQVAAFVKAAGKVDLYFVDVEGSKAPTASETAEFIGLTQHAVGKCGLYMSASVFRWSAGQDYDWVAKWGTTPPDSRYEFWQNDGSGADGIDNDYFHGSAADLAKFVGIPTAPESDIDMGLRIKLDVTLPDGDPYDNLGTAVLKTGSIRNVSTGANVVLPAGTSLGQVQTGWFLGESGQPPLATPTAIYAFNSGNELHIVAATNCSFSPAKAPVADCSAVQAKLDDANALNANYASRLIKINGLSAV